MMRLRCIVLALAILLPSLAAAQDDALRILSQPGAVGLMRHARAPGTGDPPGMRLDDCSTQRNLSDSGRAQARSVGVRLRAAGLGQARVYTSAWCRTRETAELLGLGPVETLPALNSFFAGQGDGARQTADMRAFLEAGRSGPPRILVAHQVNVTALTGVYPADTEMVVMRPSQDGYVIAGRLRFDQAATTGTR